jgi:IS605 OrfB family transposase
VGFPGLKGKHRSRPSCRFTTGPIRVEPDRHHVVLPRLGRLRTHESTRKLARRVEQGTARVLAATISSAGDRWYVSFTCEVQRIIPGTRQPRAVVGVDVGIRHLAVLSSGELIANPAPLHASLRRLRRLNRQLTRRHGPISAEGTRRLPSAGWRQARTRLARAHARVANVRRDGLHKLTAHLASEYGTIVVEQLNIAGMLRNRRLARRIADAGWGELHRQLGYKTTWAGGRLVQADRWFPSSKTCAGCQAVKAKLPLSARVFQCEACGGGGTRARRPGTRARSWRSGRGSRTSGRRSAPARRPSGSSRAPARPHRAAAAGRPDGSRRRGSSGRRC